ncbi:MAG: division/cell wall cluster transcriptional repressor MraZ [Marinilabiliales bacterium]
MTSFIGDYPCKVDVKGRITLPSAFKKQMDSSVDGRFVIKKDIYEQCLVLYPMDEWQRQIQLLRSRLNPFNKTHNRFLREFSKGMIEAALDSNNRLLIPKRLLDAAGIDREVVLAGQDDKIEIWDVDKYEQIRSDENEFAKLAEEIMGGDDFNNLQKEQKD